MRFSSISINLLEFFRIISFVFDLKYISQNSINFNMLGVFWNPQDEQISKLSLDLHLKQHLKEILRFFTAAGAVCHHCTNQKDKWTLDNYTCSNRNGCWGPEIRFLEIQHNEHRWMFNFYNLLESNLNGHRGVSQRKVEKLYIR